MTRGAWSTGTVEQAARAWRRIPVSLSPRDPATTPQPAETTWTFEHKSNVDPAKCIAATYLE